MKQKTNQAGMRKMICREYKIAILFLIAVFQADGSLNASEIGVTYSYREIQRSHSDTNSTGNLFVIETEKANLDYPFSKTFSIIAEKARSDWYLRHPDSTSYVNMRWHQNKAKLTNRWDHFNLTVDLPFWELTENQALYTRLSSDTTSNYFLPGINLKYQWDDWSFTGSYWEELDLYAMDWHRFAIFTYQVYAGSTEWEWSENQSLYFGISSIDRTAPGEFEANKRTGNFKYTFKNLLKMPLFDIKSLTFAAERSTFLGVNTDSYRAQIRGTSTMGGVKHFLTYSFERINRVTVYKEGLWAYSLIEESLKKDDLSQLIEIKGFTRLGGSSFFLVWGYKMEDSLIAQAYLDQEVSLQLKAVF